jgi:hypothetical protein
VLATGAKNTFQNRYKNVEVNMVPKITLKNGLRVANFSSPHEFNFVTGEILPACSPERARNLMLEAHEVERPSPCGKWTDLELQFEMSPLVAAALVAIESDPEIDVVLVPLPVKQAAGRAGLPLRKCRTIRVADRVSRAIHADKFCL